MQAGCFQVAGLTGYGNTGLGYDFTVSLPVIGNETISLPIEKLISDSVPLLINAAWPPLQTKIEAEVPVLLAKVQAGLPALLTTVEQSAMTNLWPQLEPKLLADMQIGINEAEKTIWLTMGLLTLAVVGSAFVIVKKMKHSA
jgi:hypothetical protein